MYTSMWRTQSEKKCAMYAGLLLEDDTLSHKLFHE